MDTDCTLRGGFQRTNRGSVALSLETWAVLALNIACRPQARKHFATSTRQHLLPIDSYELYSCTILHPSCTQQLTRMLQRWPSTTSA